MQYIRRRNNVVNTATRLCNLGLAKPTMTSGNISTRIDDENFLITPSGIPEEDLKFSDIVNTNFSGEFMGKYKPSSEWRFHKDIYQNFSDIKSVIHVHSPYATAVACTRRDIPAFHYMIGVAGGNDIKCAEYATYGTQELSDNVVKALQGRKACLLANHGMIATGDDLKSALKLAVEVEDLAEQYYRILQIGGVSIIDDKEMEKILKKLKKYGNPLKI